MRTTQDDWRIVKIQSTITIMMFTQVFLLLLCNLPSGIQKIYIIITGNYYKSPQRRAIETIIFQIVYLLTYIDLRVRDIISISNYIFYFVVFSFPSICTHWLVQHFVKHFFVGFKTFFIVVECVKKPAASQLTSRLQK